MNDRNNIKAKWKSKGIEREAYIHIYLSRNHEYNDPESKISWNNFDLK